MFLRRFTRLEALLTLKSWNDASILFAKLSRANLHWRQVMSRENQDMKHYETNIYIVSESYILIRREFLHFLHDFPHDSWDSRHAGPPGPALSEHQVIDQVLQQHVHELCEVNGRMQAEPNCRKTGPGEGPGNMGFLYVFLSPVVGFNKFPSTSLLAGLRWVNSVNLC